MPTVKTAISVPTDLFEQMDQLAKHLRIPRSRLFARALRKFIDRRRADELTERFNRAYSTGETLEERDFRLGATRAFARLLKESR